ncbi:hypothetical protein B0H10DRAFT_2209050 [Mycena sp. CBHHK59/15]|nr:hypothetical protein B0H10DRAFT_2209050 [Mycena sp. CBHHK59/15]
MPPAALLLVLGLNGEAQFTPSTPIAGATALIREVPDVLTFVEAWMIFMSILQNQWLSLPIMQALSAHLYNIIALRALDPYFNPMNWIKSDPHLHTLHLLALSISPPAPATPSVPSSTDRARMAGQTCYMYNGTGCGGPLAVWCGLRFYWMQGSICK